MRAMVSFVASGMIAASMNGAFSQSAETDHRMSVAPSIPIDCSVPVSEAKDIANQLSFATPKLERLRAGSEITLKWNVRQPTSAHSKVPLYIVVAAPSASTFSGAGFLALTSGAAGPDAIKFESTRSRAFVPLHRGVDSVGAGEIKIKPLEIGIHRFIWAVVIGGICGEHVISQASRLVEVIPGAPELVIQNKFANENPVRRVRSNSGQYELLIFERRYEVHHVATQSKVLDRPGVDANFSPTGRFVGSRVVDRGPLEVHDILSGKRIGQYRDHFIAWAAHDSFLIAGASSWGLVSVKNTIVEDKLPLQPSDTLSCHACNAWESVQVLFDLNRGFVSLAGDQGIYISDLVSGKSFSRHDIQAADSSDRYRQLGVEYIAKTYDPSFSSLPKIWTLGERLALSHAHWFENIAKQQQRFIVQHKHDFGLKQNQARPRIANNATDLVGRSLNKPIFQTPDNSQSIVFGRLAENGVVTRAALNVATIDVASDKAKDDFIRKVTANFPNTRARFSNSNEGCGSGSRQVGQVTKDHMAAVHEWKDGSALLWIVGTRCYAGSAGILNEFDLHLVEAAGARIRFQSIRDVIDGEALIGSPEDVAVKVFAEAEGYLILALQPDGLSAVVDIRTGHRVGAKIVLREPTLLKDIRRTADGNNIVQLNSDGRLFVYKIADGSPILEGAYVDDEIIFFDPDGRFEATYEGAHSVQVRFRGVSGLFTFAQFDTLLRRPNLFKAVTEQRQLEPVKSLGVPPNVIDFKLASVVSEGRRNGSVKVSGQTSLAAVRLYLDGRLIKEISTKGPRADVAIEVPDVGGGRWVSVVAVDSQGLVSLPSSILLPGKPRPRGKARVIAIGVDNYMDPNIATLASARIDAKNFSGAIAATEGRAFDAVITKLLVDSEVTPQSVFTAIADAARSTGPDDMLIVFFAGHAVEANSLGQRSSELLLTTHMSRLSNILETSVRWPALAAILNESRGTVLVLLDACHAGVAGETTIASNDSLVSTLFTKGGAPMIVLAGSKGRQLSQESPNGGGGRFTNAVVGALSRDRAQSDANKSGLLDVSEIYGAIKAKVSAETFGEQTPWLARNGLVGEMSLF